MKYCSTPHCPTLVHHGKCPAHTKVQAQQVDAVRGTAQQRGYTYQWSLYSKARLTRLPVCGMREDGSLDTTNSRCAQQGLTTMAQCTDHVVPLRHNGAMWDPSNHLSLCLPCNTWKAQTVEEGKAYAGHISGDQAVQTIQGVQLAKVCVPTESDLECSKHGR